MDPDAQQEKEPPERKGLVHLRQRHQVHGSRLEKHGEEGEDREDGDREGYADDSAGEVGDLVSYCKTFSGGWEVASMDGCVIGWVGGYMDGDVLSLLRRHRKMRRVR